MMNVANDLFFKSILPFKNGMYHLQDALICYRGGGICFEEVWGLEFGVIRNLIDTGGGKGLGGWKFMKNGWGHRVVECIK